MQHAATADLRARKARLRASWKEIARAAEALGYPYSAGRIRKVVNDHEPSAPLLAAVDEALAAIEGARAGDGRPAEADHQHA